VLIAVKRTLQAVLCDELSKEFNEYDSVAIKVKLNATYCYINAVYFPPSTHSNILLQYAEYVESLSNLLNGNFMIIGDFNLPEISSSDYDFSIGSVKARILYNLMSFYDLNSYSSDLNELGRTLDLVLSNVPVSVETNDDPLLPEDGHHPALSVDALYIAFSSGVNPNNSLESRYNLLEVIFSGYIVS